MSAALAMHEVRARAQHFANAGAWSDATALLLQHEARIREHPPCAALLAESYMRTGRAREAREWLAGVLPAIELSDDRASLRRATVLFGAAHFALGELERARRRFEEAMELARADGDDPLVARSMYNLGTIANITGDRTGALALYRLALSVLQRLGDRQGLAECYHNMAITYRDLGKWSEADELEQRSAEFARDAGQPRIVSIARLGRAKLALQRDDLDFAEATARFAAADFAALGDPVLEAAAKRLAGVACTRRGDYARARELLDFAVTRSLHHEATLTAAESLRSRAELALAEGNRVAARQDAEEALRLFDKLSAVEDLRALQRWISAL